MIRLHRKWWLLRELRNECRRVALEKLSIGQLHFDNKASVAREAFLGQVANKSLHRFSKILRRRKKDQEIKKKKRLQEYNSIFNELTATKLVHEEDENTFVDESGTILNPPGRPFFRTTAMGDKYISDFWYQAYFNNPYTKTIVTGVVTAIVIAIGTSYIKQAFKEVTQPPAVNVYPNININSPDYKPTINLYPIGNPSSIK